MGITLHRLILAVAQPFYEFLRVCFCEYDYSEFSSLRHCLTGLMLAKDVRRSRALLLFSGAEISSNKNLETIQQTPPFDDATEAHTGPSTHTPTVGPSTPIRRITLETMQQTPPLDDTAEAHAGPSTHTPMVGTSTPI